MTNFSEKIISHYIVYRYLSIKYPIYKDTSVNTGAIAPACTHFSNYIYNWWYCNVIKLMNKIKVYL